MRVVFVVAAMLALCGPAAAEGFACGTDCNTACYEPPASDRRFEPMRRVRMGNCHNECAASLLKQNCGNDSIKPHSAHGHPPGAAEQERARDREDRERPRPDPVRPRGPR